MLAKQILPLLVAAIAVSIPLKPLRAEQGKIDVKPPQVGDTAKDIEFQPLDGKKLKLSELTAKGPVVLVVLRGYPGYQCPLCTRQVGQLRKSAPEFENLGARVVLVYPGEAKELKQRATEFLQDNKLPDPLTLVLDPDMMFTELYALRWSVPGETAFPSTFVLDKDRKVLFSKVSHSHAQRSKVEDLLAVLKAMHTAETATGQEIPQTVPRKVLNRR